MSVFTPNQRRQITAHIELPQDGSMGAMRIYIKSNDGKDLTFQAVLDAVSDVLIDEVVLDYGEDDPVYDA
jgi:predicted hotdog family 3-hydroxylacyl-ACP dehydratase